MGWGISKAGPTCQIRIRRERANTRTGKSQSLRCVARDESLLIKMKSHFGGGVLQARVGSYGGEQRAGSSLTLTSTRDITFLSWAGFC